MGCTYIEMAGKGVYDLVRCSVFIEVYLLAKLYFRNVARRGVRNALLDGLAEKVGVSGQFKRDMAAFGTEGPEQCRPTH